MTVCPDLSSDLKKNGDDWDNWWFPFNRHNRLKDKRCMVVSDFPVSDNEIFAPVSQTSQS